MKSLNMSQDANSYDLFISYRWDGDVAYEHEGRGWVWGFRDAIEARLKSRLNVDVRIFLDLEELRRYEPLHQALRARIESSTLFLCIVTESSSRLGSWARWEVEHFNNCASPVCGPPAGRIFKAALFPTDRAAEPEVLRDHAEYKFYGRFGREANGAPFPYPLDQLLDPTTPPGAEFDRLVQNLGERLEQAESLAAGAPAEGRVVYVASTNLTAKRERLCGELRRKGYRVVAETPWPECSAEEFRERAGMRLVEVDASIHVLGEQGSPAGWNQSFSEVELQKAMDVAGRPDKGAFRIYTWEDTEAAGAPAKSLAPLYARLSQVRAVTNFNSKGWEYALSNIFLSLEKAPVPQPAAEEPKAAPVPCNRQVFVHCLEDDRDLAQEIHEKLLDHNVWVCFLPQPLKFWRRICMRQKPLPDDARVIERFRRFYRECEGTLVLFGQAPEIWAWERCDDIHDFFGDNLARKAAAVCLAPPDEGKKRTFQYQGFSKYRLAEIENYVQLLVSPAPGSSRAES